MDKNTIIAVVILILAAMAHEIAHGYMADHFGDMTPRESGSLTLNPIKHLDLVGSLIVPAAFLISKRGLILAWA